MLASYENFGPVQVVYSNAKSRLDPCRVPGTGSAVQAPRLEGRVSLAARTLRLEPVNGCADGIRGMASSQT